ncbi:hypothetical protein BBJ28_00001475 [Nothophytophthora sp. Chile5]|nr:hypothetical protein BBJ28_00001475 [Nothophytophthora sp. Chile5]
MRGAGRRGGGGGRGSARRSAAEPSTTPKTALVAEWRAHEEDCAARVLQLQIRAFLSRQRVAHLLASVYEKHYDPMRKQHYYVNTQTNASTWDKPRLLERFLPADSDVARGQVELAPNEAARRIQRLARAFLAMKTIRQLVRENYMKLFDAENQVFYYLDTRSGERSEHKPPFFRRNDQDGSRRGSRKVSRDDDDDLSIEPFHFRQAVCKIASASNPHGSGVVGRFCGMLCVLTDGQTLADEDSARTARVACNYSDERVAFPVLLASETFFAGIKLPGGPQAERRQSPSPRKKPPNTRFDFALCALNEDQFLLAAGANVVPLRLELNDRKLGCGEAGSLRSNEYLEVVGHPHGKLQVLHLRQLAKLVPNSINPQQLQYDRVMETGSAGSAVFTRGGKLVGIQAFAAPKEPPPLQCWYIKPVLDAALALIMYWQLPRDWHPLRGLPVDFELEICRHDTHNAQRHELFERAYLGPQSSQRVAKLRCDTMYSVRCRAANRMKKSAWSTVVRFITLPQVSLAWRLRHCGSVKEAVKAMWQQQADPQTQFRSVQWIYAQLEKRQEADKAEEKAVVDEAGGEDPLKLVISRQLQLEQELLECQGLELLLDALAWFPTQSTTIALILRLLLKLTRLQKSTQRFLTEALRFERLCELLQSHTSTDGNALQPEEHGEGAGKEESMEALQIPLLCLELLGAILDENGSAKLVLEGCSGIPLVLSFLERDLYRLQTAIVAECCYILALFSYENGKHVCHLPAFREIMAGLHSHRCGLWLLVANGKWQIVQANGLALLQGALQEHRQDSRVLYWALVALGNVAYAVDEETELPQLQAEVSSLGLVASVCDCRVHFLSRLQELELKLGKLRAKLEHLHAIHVGEETRNELDASEHLVETLNGVIADWQRNDVAEAADYALRYLLTEEQRRVQLASQRLMRKFLRRTLSMAMEKWSEATVFERHRTIFLMFITTVRTRQLRPAFRRWEQVARGMRKHKSIIQTLGSGLAIDLAKKKKERYRMLVLQK